MPAQIKPEMLLRSGAVMRNPEYAVCLVPQHFHNLTFPDVLDHANYDMVNKLEYAFAGGILLLTGEVWPLTRCRTASLVFLYLYVRKDTSEQTFHVIFASQSYTRVGIDVGLLACLMSL